jgi:hypothetical protein
MWRFLQELVTAGDGQASLNACLWPEPRQLRSIILSMMSRAFIKRNLRFRSTSCQFRLGVWTELRWLSLLLSVLKFPVFNLIRPEMLVSVPVDLKDCKTISLAVLLRMRECIRIHTHTYIHIYTYRL